MGINVFPQNNGIIPTKFASTNATQTPVVQNTYYTILNVTSGVGWVESIQWVFAGGTSKTSNIRITIDGGTPIVINGDSSFFDLPRITSTSHSFIMDCGFYFRVSLLIEISNTSDTTAFNHKVNYALV